MTACVALAGIGVLQCIRDAVSQDRSGQPLRRVGLRSCQKTVGILYAMDSVLFAA